MKLKRSVTLSSSLKVGCMIPASERRHDNQHTTAKNTLSQQSTGGMKRFLAFEGDFRP
jgi:hypothetical protein